MLCKVTSPVTASMTFLKRPRIAACETPPGWGQECRVWGERRGVLLFRRRSGLAAPRCFLRESSRSGPPTGAGLQSEIWDLCWLLEVDDETGRDAGAIGVRAGGIEADVVHLWAESQMWKQADVHAAAKAIGKLAVGAAARSSRDARAAKEGLRKGINFRGVPQSQSRTEEIGVSIQRNAAGGGVVPAEISDDASRLSSTHIRPSARA